MVKHSFPMTCSWPGWERSQLSATLAAESCGAPLLTGSPSRWVTHCTGILDTCGAFPFKVSDTHYTAVLDTCEAFLFKVSDTHCTAVLDTCEAFPFKVSDITVQVFLTPVKHFSSRWVTHTMQLSLEPVELSPLTHSTPGPRYLIPCWHHMLTRGALPTRFWIRGKARWWRNT